MRVAIQRKFEEATLSRGEMAGRMVFRAAVGVSSEEGWRVLEDAFFDVVHVEEEFYIAGRVAELGDVGFEVFLHLFR